MRHGGRVDPLVIVRRIPDGAGDGIEESYFYLSVDLTRRISYKEMLTLVQVLVINCRGQ